MNKTGDPTRCYGASKRPVLIGSIFYSSQFFVDGRRLEEISKLSHVHIPERHLQPKFVIGARWAGSASKYDDYFHGKISGLVLLSHEPINQKVISSLYKVCNFTSRILSRHLSATKLCNKLSLFNLCSQYCA